MSRPFSPNETARQKSYRHLYTRVKNQLDLQEDRIEYLLKRVDHLQERLNKLECVHDAEKQTDGG